MTDTSLNKTTFGKTTFGGLSPPAQAIVDRLCDEFERQRKASDSVLIDDFLKQAPAEIRSHLLCELLALDVEYRRRIGQQPELSDYQPRYPEIDAAWFQRMLDGAEETMAFLERVGRVMPSGKIVGEYELCRRLGRGGMGEVYLARHRLMDREVAVKLLAPELLQRPDAVSRFHREVKTAARLVHANIVTAYDAGQFDGRHYLVMQYVPGVDLRSLVVRDGPLPVPTAVDYVVQAARGLAYAHQQGIVHRDVKPSNLLLDTDGVVKVLDMGLARLDGNLSLNEAKLTAPNMLIGTVGFMAPEQGMDPGHADHRADVYSLGCTLYFLLTGRSPYQADSALDTILAHDRQPIPSLVEARPDVPLELVAIFEKMMAKSPGDRFASMDAMISELRQVIAPKAPVEPPPLPDQHKPLRPTRQFGRTAILVAGVVPALLLIVTIGVAILYTGRESNPPNLIAPFNARTARDGQTVWARHLGLPGGEPTITNSLGMQLVLIPPGQFTQGTPRAEVERLMALLDSADYEFVIRDEPSPRQTSIEHPFWIGGTEVTVAHFRSFVEAEAYVTEAERSEAGGWGVENGQWTQRPGFNWQRQGERPVAEDQPVSNVTWNDAMSFCDWLSRTETELAGRSISYRLPYESEWEYACRAGAQSPWFWGDAAADIDPYVWYAGNSNQQAQSVGRKSPNAFGLFDMLGNVREWCRDELPDGSRVQRGGSFLDPPLLNRCASRATTDASSPTHGAFRVVRVVEMIH